MSKSKHLYISHDLAVICTWKVSYHLAKIFGQTMQKSNYFFLGQKERYTTENKVD